MCVDSKKNKEKVSRVFLGGDRNGASWAQSSLAWQARGAEQGECPLLPTVLRRTRLHALSSKDVHAEGQVIHVIIPPKGDDPEYLSTAPAG